MQPEDLISLGAIYHPAAVFNVLVTPDLATYMLDDNKVDNRKILNATLDDYTRKMSKGEFPLTHQSIAFDKSGILFDGQHRLQAVVRSGVPTWLAVAFHCDGDTFAKIDGGTRRSAAQLIKRKNAGVIQSASSFLMVAEGCDVPATLINEGAYLSKASADERLDCIGRWLDEMEEYVDKCAAACKSTNISSSMLLAVACLASRSPYWYKVDEWLEGLTSGVGLTSTDSRLHLRNRWVRDFKTLNRHDRALAYFLIIKAWNSFALGNPMGALKMGHLETPTVTGYDYPSPSVIE